MTNDLVTTQNNAVATPGMGVNAFLALADELGGQDAGYYLKFSGKNGEFTFGSDGEILEHGHRLAVAPLMLAHGWACWVDQEFKGEVMVPVHTGEPVPTKESLPDYGPYEGDRDGWQPQYYMHLRSISTGDEYKLKLGGSKSGARAFGNFLKQYANQMSLHDGELPVIEINAAQFPAKDKNGKVIKGQFAYAPVFKIVGWKSEEELQEILENSLLAKEAEEELEPVVEPPKKPAAAGGGRKRTF